MGERTTATVTDAALIERRVTVWTMRVEGRTLAEIAREVGVSVDTVRRDIIAAAEELKGEAPAAVRQVELQRLDKMWQRVHAVLTAPRPLFRYGQEIVESIDYDVLHKAMEVGLKIQDRRARLLGLDAPVRVDASVDLTPPTPALLAKREAAARYAEATAPTADEDDDVDG